MSREKFLRNSQYSSFKQFTPDGADLFIEYYNKKYLEREKLRHVKAKQYLVSHIGISVSVAEAIAQIHEIKKSVSDETPLKIVFTTYYEQGRLVPEGFGSLEDDDSHLTPEDSPKELILSHSTPIVLTKEKLILLREDSSMHITLNILSGISRELGLNFVKMGKGEVESRESDNRSIQSDNVSCLALAVGILKDLDEEKLKEVVAFEDGSKLSPVMLKYSQSIKYIKEEFPELITSSIKPSGETLIEYVERGREEAKKSGSAYTRDRITGKSERFKKDVSILAKEDLNIEGLAEEILKKRHEEKPRHK